MSSALANPPPLPAVRPPSALQRLLAQVTMGRPGDRAGVYRELVRHGKDALDALDALFPGRLFLDGDLASLFNEPLEEAAPVLEAIRHFGSDGLAVLERHSSASDPTHRLAVARAVHDFSHALAGRILAKLTADTHPRVSEGACLALRSGRHPGGLKRARDTAVEELEASDFHSDPAWMRCVRLDAGRALAAASARPWRRLRGCEDWLGELSWHTPAQQPTLMKTLARNPELPLARVRTLALTHHDRDLRVYAVDKLGRSHHGALAFDPDGTEIFRGQVAERLKRAAFE